MEAGDKRIGEAREEANHEQEDAGVKRTEVGEMRGEGGLEITHGDGCGQESHHRCDHIR